MTRVGKVTCISGVLRSPEREVLLPEGKILYIGRNESADFRCDSKWVANRHVIVSYHSAINKYHVHTIATNGIYAEKGIYFDRDIMLDPGTKFYLDYKLEFCFLLG